MNGMSPFRKAFCERRNILKSMSELEDKQEDFKSILTTINLDQPYTDTLYKYKYLILFVENFLKWLPSFGDVYETNIVICAAEPKKIEPEIFSPVFKEEFHEDMSGSPLSVMFDSFSSPSQKKKGSSSVSEQLVKQFNLFPVPKSIAIKLLHIYQSARKGTDKEKVPAVAICHGPNPQLPILMGSQFLENKHLGLLIKNQGTINKQEQLPRLESLMQIHLAAFPPFSDIDVLVNARYDFLKYEPDERSLLYPVKTAQLFVDCSWSNSSAILESVTADCTCYVDISGVSGRTDSGASTLYKELLLIEALQNSLETGIMNFPTMTSTCDMEDLQKLFSMAQSAELSKRVASNPAVIDWEFFDFLISRERENLDFTDKLWIILKGCANMEELTRVLEEVYSELGELTIPPFVFDKNKSTIAKDIKKMMDTPITPPTFSNQLAIKLLLEIGIEKLRRNYISFFLGLELVPYDCLSYYLQPEHLSKETICRLKKLHSVVELVIVCVKRLCLSREFLSEFVRNTLTHFTNIEADEKKNVFRFQIPTVKARQVLDSMRPTLWEIRLQSKTSDFMKQSVHRYLTTPIHEHIYAPKHYHPKLMLKTASYSYITATVTETDVEFAEEDKIVY